MSRSSRLSVTAFGLLAVFVSTALRPALAETRPPAAASPAAVPDTAGPSREEAAYPQIPADRQLTMVHKRRTGAILGGAVIFGISYGTARW